MNELFMKHSIGRRIRNIAEVMSEKLTLGHGPFVPKQLRQGVTMLDRKVYRWWTDGSLRRFPRIRRIRRRDMKRLRRTGEWARMVSRGEV